jgi:thioredoxin reductase (NADPH)
MKEVELAIVGGGIAGLSCALYAKRAGLDPIVLEKSALGGQLLYIDKIDNYPGLKANTKGSQLLSTLTESVKSLGVSIVEEEPREVKIESGKVCFSTSKDNYQARAVVVSTGAVFKKLGVKGESEFSGKGVSWCAVCDGYFFKDKEVAVVGGGNSALCEATYLAGICKKVTLLHRRNKLRAADFLQQQISTLNNIECVFDTVIKEIKGKQFLDELILENTTNSKISSLKVNGLFVAIGISPNTDIFKNIVSVDGGGFIITDQHMKTSCDFIWACGDCRMRPLRQLITAASEGATAAISAYKYLKDDYISV